MYLMILDRLRIKVTVAALAVAIPLFRATPALSLQVPTNWRNWNPVAIECSVPDRRNRLRGHEPWLDERLRLSVTALPSM
jgi:hypothetical protein